MGCSCSTLCNDCESMIAWGVTALSTKERAGLPGERLGA